MSRLAANLAALLVTACGHHAAAASARRGFLALASDMQPQVVAQALVRVEDEWKAQAAAYAECSAAPVGAEDCKEAPKAFQKSCATVLSAVVQASSGQKAVVAEYMGDVCAERVLQGWRQERCQGLAEQLVGAMTEDDFDNRAQFRAGPVCTALFARFNTEEQARVVWGRKKAEEAHERAEAARKAAEEGGEVDKAAPVEETENVTAQRVGEKATAEAPSNASIVSPTSTDSVETAALQPQVPAPLGEVGNSTAINASMALEMEAGNASSAPAADAIPGMQAPVPEASSSTLLVLPDNVTANMTAAAVEPPIDINAPNSLAVTKSTAVDNATNSEQENTTAANVSMAGATTAAS